MAATFRGMKLSSAAQTHVLKKLRAPSKCCECSSYVYFNGAECDRVDDIFCTLLYLLNVTVINVTLFIHFILITI